MTSSKLVFSSVDWTDKADGIWEKAFDIYNKRFRLLKLRKGLSHPDWCETGHSGYVVSGELEIIFDRRTLKFGQGDALFIEAGKDERHIPKPLTAEVILFLIEDF